MEFGYCYTHKESRIVYLNKKKVSGGKLEWLGIQEKGKQLKASAFAFSSSMPPKSQCSNNCLSSAMKAATEMGVEFETEQSWMVSGCDDFAPTLPVLWSWSLWVSNALLCFNLDALAPHELRGINLFLPSLSMWFAKNHIGASWIQSAPRLETP